jgi:signal transduction histidine kinase
MHAPESEADSVGQPSSGNFFRPWRRIHLSRAGVGFIHPLDIVGCSAMTGCDLPKPDGFGTEIASGQTMIHWAENRTLLRFLPDTGSGNGTRTRALNRNELHVLGELIAQLTHRLRSPMTAISGFSELLEHETKPEKLRYYAQQIREATDHMNRILSELDVLRLTQSVCLSRFTAASLSEAVIAELPADPSRLVTWLVEPTDATLHSDFHLLKRVLLELIRNGIEGGGTEAGHTILVHITPRVMRVTNHGALIPDSMTHQLYHPFTGTKSKQMGIGLAIAHHFCSLLHYSLQLAHNNTQKGVVFDIRGEFGHAI